MCVRKNEHWRLMGYYLVNNIAYCANVRFYEHTRFLCYNYACVIYVSVVSL